MRFLVAFALLALAAFCAFGLLATFEPARNPNAALAWRVGYGVGLLVCLRGAWQALAAGDPD